MLTLGVAGDNNLLELFEAPLLILGVLLLFVVVVHCEKELDRGELDSLDETNSWFEKSMPTSSTGKDDMNLLDWPSSCFCCWLLLLDSMEFLSRFLNMKFELLFMSIWLDEEASCWLDSVLISSVEHFMPCSEIKLDDSSFTI